MSFKKKQFFFALCAVFALLSLCSFFLHKQPHICIGIISDNTFCGERELAWRIKHAAENLGWKTFLDENQGHGLKKKKGLDWVICTVPQHRQYSRYSHNYVTLLHPLSLNQTLYERKHKHSPQFHEKYDGYLLTINPGKEFEDFLTAKKNHFFSTTFYPTLQHTGYVKVPLNNIVTMIPVWGNRLEDEKFKALYSLLSEGGFTKFYGINNQAGIAESNYLDKLPFDGISVVKALQRHGITLIFHSDIHNREKIPSSRIFEAAAASTVIISDNNAFVKKHFGESVFYVDTTLSAEEIYLQIKNHMAFIRQDPEKALEMAKRAHQIFVDQFLMETQLENIMAMHQKVLEHEQQKRLSQFLRPFRVIFSFFGIGESS